MIEIGQTVTWTSQSGGHSKTKTGKVLGFIPANWFDYVHCTTTGEYSFMIQTSLGKRRIWGFRNRFKFDLRPTTADRILVEVRRLNKRGEPTRSGVYDYYAPLLSVVEKQNEVTPK